MTHRIPSIVRAVPIALALVAGSGASAAALAQSAAEPAAPAAEPVTMRLSDAERDAILDANTEASAAAARGEPVEAEEQGRRIHGEVGVMLGTNGTRGVYGVADVPLGENGGATIAFESSRIGYGRGRARSRADR